MSEKFFIHSRCCNGHWELAYRHGEYILECENCWKLAGPFEIRGPTLDSVQTTILSNCCRANWELTYQDGDFNLECVECGHPITNVTVTGPSMGECQCEICSRPSLLN